MKTILLFLIIAFATLPTKATSFYNVVDSTKFNQDSLNYEFDKKLKKFTSAKFYQDSINYEVGNKLKKFTENLYLGTIFNAAGSFCYLTSLTNGANDSAATIGFVLILIGMIIILSAPMQIKNAGIMLMSKGSKKKKVD